MPLTQQQIEELKCDYANTPSTELAKRWNVPLRMVYREAYIYGLKKSKECIANTIRLNYSAKSSLTQFKQGQIAFNKGKKQSEYMSVEAIAKSRAKCFKKGHLPHNIKDVGYERISKTDGYVYIKLEGNRRMVLKHRHIWEQANGKILKGYIIQFRDGNPQNCALENLFLISRKEQIKNNTIHRYPEEIKTAIRRIGKINQLIKNKKHETNQY